MSSEPRSDPAQYHPDVLWLSGAGHGENWLARGGGGGWVGLGWTLPALVRQTRGGVGPPEAAHPSMKSLESGRPCSTP